MPDERLNKIRHMVLEHQHDCIDREFSQRKKEAAYITDIVASRYVVLAPLAKDADDPGALVSLAESALREVKELTAPIGIRMCYSENGPPTSDKPGYKLGWARLSA